jgi:Response regulator receiver domain
LLDIRLSNLNGLEAAHRIGQNAPDSKIVFLTTQDDPHVVKHALRNGATGYVLKLFAKTELLAAIAAVLEGHCFVSRRLPTNFDVCDWPAFGASTPLAVGENSPWRQVLGENCFHQQHTKGLEVQAASFKTQGSHRPMLVRRVMLSHWF